MPILEQFIKLKVNIKETIYNILIQKTKFDKKNKLS